MQKRQIGNSEIYVSTMGIGTTKFGRNELVKYPIKFNLPNEKQIERLLKICFENGVNLIDTAPAYGTSEERLGKIIHKERTKWIICTKVGEYFSNKNSFYDFSVKAIQKSLENSLQKFKTDYLDIVLLHSNGEAKKVLPSLEFLKEAKKKGTIRLFGISSKTKKEAVTALKSADLAMIHYNIDYTKMQQVLDFAKKEGKGIFIKKAFQSGYLLQQKKNLKENIDFILANSAVSSIILGTINQKHLKNNLTFF